MFMKNKILIKILCYFTISIAGILLISCGKKSNPNTLAMACSADYPPFEFRKSGSLIGFDIQLAHSICKKLGYSLEISDMNFDGLIAALNSGRVDFVMSGMTMTEERKKHVDFSQMYYEPQFAIMYRKHDVVDSANKMKGKIIGVQLGTTMETFVKEKANELGNIDVKVLNRNPELIQELKVGRIDALVIEKSQVEHFVEANPDLAYSGLKEHAGIGYAIAFPKDSKLRAEFDKILSEMKENGELIAILKQWLL